MKIKNDSSNVSNMQLSLKGTFEWDSLSFKEQHTLYFMNSIKAPAFTNETSSKRAPIDVICVIDVSGSMEGEKLSLVKKTLQFMILQLGNTDRLGLIAFDTRVSVEFEIIQMDDFGKKRASSHIDGLRAGTSTNLSGGLFEAYQMVKDRKNPQDVCSILLFTDGLANHGITKTPDIIKAMDKIDSKGSNLFTFGFGKDHDANMLRPIAEAGHGLYYYIEKEDEIPNSFADCIGGLLSVVAQNIKLKISASGSTKILNSFSKYPQKLTESQVEISVGDLYGEEEKDLLLQIQIPKLEAQSDKHVVIDSKLTYYNVITKSFEELSCCSIINRPEKTEPCVGNYNIDKQRNRVLTSDALQKARNFADERKLSEAREVLNKMIIKIQESISAQDPMSKGLIEDLKSLLDNLVDTKSYQEKGNKMMNDFYQTSNVQRSAKETIFSKNYETTAKVKSKSDSRSYFSK